VKPDDVYLSFTPSAAGCEFVCMLVDICSISVGKLLSDYCVRHFVLVLFDCATLHLYSTKWGASDLGLDVVQAIFMITSHAGSVSRCWYQGWDPAVSVAGSLCRVAKHLFTCQAALF